GGGNIDLHRRNRFIFVGLFWGGGHMGTYAKDVLVDTDWVAENIDNPDIRLIEVDEDTAAYERGHIRNAVGLNWKSDLQDPLRRDFVDEKAFATLMDKAGVTPDTEVILY